MKKYLFGAVLALLTAALAPASGLAADAWLLDTSQVGAPKAKVSATLTYTDVSLGKSVTVKYKPLAVKVLVERDVDGEQSKHVTNINLTAGADASISLNAGMLGSGLKSGNTSTLTAAINPETDVDFPFQFSDTFSRSMTAGNVMASSAEGSYTETVDKGGNPTGPIKLSITYTVAGNLDGTNIPAKITVKVSASNVQPKP